MNIKPKNRRKGERGIDLRWAAVLAVAAASIAGSSAAAQDAPGHPGVAFENSEQEEQERIEAEQRAALMQRAQASDRHLQTLADLAEQRALYEHIDNEADARAEAAAEAAAVRERELQAQGSDQHLENLAEQGERASSGEPD